jgi:hypothetical protein
VRRILSVTFCAAMAIAVLASPARAADVIFTGSQGSLAASVQFVTSGTQLVVTLTNTGGAAAVPADVLTNVLFNCSGCGTLTGVSAVTSGATLQNSLQISPSGTAVGGEWALVTSAGGNFQIASSGANGAGASDPLFPPGVDLDNPAAPAGINYGIANTISGSANQGVTANPITLHDVVFTLACSQNCANASFSNIVFQYGTSANEPSFGGGTGTGTASGQNLVPEPTSLLLFGSGLAATAYRARRKKNPKDS